MDKDTESDFAEVIELLKKMGHSDDEIQKILVRLQQYELAIEQLRRAERRVTAGDLPEIEVVRAESGVAERVDGIIRADASVRRAQRNLKRIMNRDDLPIDNPTAIVVLLDPAEDPQRYWVGCRPSMSDGCPRRVTPRGPGIGH